MPLLPEAHEPLDPEARRALRILYVVIGLGSLALGYFGWARWH